MLNMILLLAIAQPCEQPQYTPLPPMTHECDWWLPSHEVCEKNAAAAREHLEWIERQPTIDHGTPAEWIWQQGIDEARFSFLIWQRSARYRTNQGSNPTSDDVDRDNLRRDLGERAWWAGEMPAPVPAWRWSGR